MEVSLFSTSVFTTVSGLVILVGAADKNGTLLTGKAAMGEWTSDASRIRRQITGQDLPPPAPMFSQLTDRMS